MARKSKIQTFTDKRGAHRWHLRASNGKIVCQGEGHGSRAKALRAALAVQRAFAGAVVAD